ncbi:hypothetical protein AKG08_17360 [Achromobacter piechaudii]|uniref:hypothetical protein n=1 Tax=Achromobacter piechaudii TaxID=72556 RepID=UPI000680BA2C|nr:hypothetical protein [Achromobacter piechaudii]KNY09410.1 hypothetical protein AKG08_17360 [Achromobacter piechaudii]
MENNTPPLTEEHQWANRYALATVDMEEAIRYLDCYEKILQLNFQSLGQHTCHGLLSAAIVAYCRPFGTNYSTGYAASKLHADALPSVKKRSALHNLLISKRNTYIAHSDWKARSVQITVIGPTSLHVSFSRLDITQELDVKEFRTLADDVRQDCVFKVLPHAKAGAPQVNDA